MSSRLGLSLALLAAVPLAADASDDASAPPLEVKASDKTQDHTIGVTGVGHGVGKADKGPAGGGATGGSGSGSGGGGVGAKAGAASGAPPAQPPWQNMTLTVTCGDHQNVLKWITRDGANSNSVIRNVNGASGAWVCGGPASIPPCTKLTVTSFTDTNVSPGNVYEYRHKDSPTMVSNTVRCPPAPPPAATTNK